MFQLTMFFDLTMVQRYMCDTHSVETVLLLVNSGVFQAGETWYDRLS